MNTNARGDFPSTLRRVFVIFLFIFAFFLMILYVNETESFVTSPYLTHIKNVVKNSKNLIASYADGKSRS